MRWQDLAIAVTLGATNDDGGLSGMIEAGKILVDGLAPDALPARLSGRRRTALFALCFKRMARRTGCFLPLAIWQDTTTLYVTIYALDGQGAPTTVAATGVIHIHLIDFLKQMLTLAPAATPGRWPIYAP